ncbi:Amino acid transporter AVT6B-like protein [Drosera capensis]
MPPFTAPKNHRTTTTSKPPLLPTKPRRDSVHSASAVGAVLNLSTTIIGAGIMALPATLKQLGVVIGLFFIVIVGVLTERSIEIVLRFTRAARCDSYAGVVGDAFGVGGKRVLQGCVVMFSTPLILDSPRFSRKEKQQDEDKGMFWQDDILANFDEDLGIPYSSLLNDVVRMSYCLHLMLVFPIVFFSLRLNVDGLLFPHAIPIAYDNKRFYSLTAALVVILFLGANYVPSIWVAFQFTGATATVSVGFIFPAAVALRDRHNIAMKKDRLISMVMIFLAVSSSSVAISSDIYSIFTAKNSEGSGLPFG